MWNNWTAMQFAGVRIYQKNIPYVPHITRSLALSHSDDVVPSQSWLIETLNRFTLKDEFSE